MHGFVELCDRIEETCGVCIVLVKNGDESRVRTDIYFPFVDDFFCTFHVFFHYIRHD